MQLRFLRHQQIDKAAWSQCINAASNSLIYASVDYLDAMSPGWDALVLGDYDAVMPLTWRRKFGITYLCQPAFTQQLGVFFKTGVSPELIPIFLNEIGNEFRLAELFLNYSNGSQAPLLPHANYILPLNDSYLGISSRYKQDLVKNLNRTRNKGLLYLPHHSAADAIGQYQEVYGGRMNMQPLDYEAFTSLCNQFIVNQKAFVRKVTLQNGELLAIGLFLRDRHRIYNIASTTLPNGRMLEANHFLFDCLIREFSESGLLLDFEGSDLPGIARFYQKFGATNQPYGFFSVNRLPALIRWWKR